MPRSDLRTVAQRKKAFLDAYSQIGTVLHAAQAVGINRRTHQLWMQNDPAYAERFEEAKADVLEVYENEIHRRAVDGWLEPVWHKGEVVGVIRKFSDTLLIFRTKALAPEKYRDRVDHRVSADVTLKTAEVEASKLLMADPVMMAKADEIAQSLLEREDSRAP